MLKIVLVTALVWVCGKSVIINNKTGHDVPQCLQQNSSSPCKTLSYVFSNASLLNNSEIVLFGNHLLPQTLTVSHVEGLTIQSGGETASIIKCVSFTNGGSGLVIMFALRVKIFNVKLEGWNKSVNKQCTVSFCCHHHQKY